MKLPAPSASYIAEHAVGANETNAGTRIFERGLNSLGRVGRSYVWFDTSVVLTYSMYTVTNRPHFRAVIGPWLQTSTWDMEYLARSQYERLHGPLRLPRD